jgi:hypothetical protein
MFASRLPKPNKNSQSLYAALAQPVGDGSPKGMSSGSGEVQSRWCWHIFCSQYINQ